MKEIYYKNLKQNFIQNWKRESYVEGNNDEVWEDPYLQNQAKRIYWSWTYLGPTVTSHLQFLALWLWHAALFLTYWSYDSPEYFTVICDFSILVRSQNSQNWFSTWLQGLILNIAAETALASLGVEGSAGSTCSEIQAKWKATVEPQWEHLFFNKLFSFYFYTSASLKVWQLHLLLNSTWFILFIFLAIFIRKLQMHQNTFT